MSDLPHLTAEGDVHMVDVSAKDTTVREAVAEATVVMSEPTADLLFGGALPKGDALAVVRVAGIMAAKETSRLVPLAHPLPLTGVRVDVERVPAGARIVATVGTTARTGVEMEALTAAAVAALSLYDMVKGVERGVVVERIRLLRKTGGRTGTWEAEG